MKKSGSGFDNIIKKAKDLQKLKIEVGWFDGLRYPEKQENINNNKKNKSKLLSKKESPTVASIAIIQEYGSPKQGIPSRSFIRSSIKENRQDIAKLFSSGLKSVLKEKETIENVYEGVGLRASKLISKKITQIQEPPLKEATVKARAKKLSNKKITASLRKPLVDSGFMLSSLTHVVSKK